ncbi:MAG: hypothetical protein H6Q74_2475 [Firmicutes bacterium]|nr:hypothetical protein [Bacillota bacterium]
MKLLKYFLYNQVTIMSDRKPEEVINVIKMHVDNKNSFFEGNVTNYKFNMHRRCGKYERNSFVPIFKGKVILNHDGSEISIVVHLHYLVAIFMIIWTVGILVGVYNGVFVHHNFLPVLLLGILCFAWLICWQVYDGEIIQAINYLKRMLS